MSWSLRRRGIRTAAAADATCVDHARAVSAIHARLGSADQGPEMASYDDARAGEATRQVVRIRAVIPPPELDELHFSLIRAHADYADAYAVVAERSAAGDEAGRRTANRRRDEFGNGLLATARSLGLTACARMLPPAAEREVAAVARRVLTGTGGDASCDRDVTPRFIASNAGGAPAGCRQVLAALRTDGATVRVVAITGVDTVLAGVTVDFAAAAGRPAKRLVYDMIWDDAEGSWRIDSAYEPARARPDTQSRGETGGASGNGDT